MVKPKHRRMPLEEDSSDDKKLLQGNKKLSRGKMVLIIIGLVAIFAIIFNIFNDKPKSEPQGQSTKQTRQIPAVVVTNHNNTANTQQTNNKPAATFSVLKRWSRDSNSYTQCFAFFNSNVLLESSGLYEQSSIFFQPFDQQASSFSPPSLVFNVSSYFKNQYFAEGCVFTNNKAYLLTWREGKVFVFNKDLQLIDTLSLPNGIREGWGLTEYKNQLILSDGSDTIFFINPDDFTLTSKLKVTGCSARSCRNINELEIYKGRLLANVYTSNIILVIDINSGKVLQEYNMKSLSDEVMEYMNDEYYERRGFVLNGIAYDEPTDVLLITGKFWPFVYSIKLNNFVDEIQKS